MPAREFSEHPGNFADKSCASEGVSFRPFPSPFPCPFVFPVFANERSEGCQSHKDWHAKWRQGVRGAHSHVAKHGTLRVLACTAVSAKALQARVASKAMPNGTCHWLGTHAARRGSWRRVSSGSGGCGAGLHGLFLWFLSPLALFIYLFLPIFVGALCVVPWPTAGQSPPQRDAPILEPALGVVLRGCHDQLLWRTIVGWTELSTQHGHKSCYPFSSTVS